MARSLGFSCSDAYAAARRLEFEAARNMLGIAPERCHRLGFPDQETCFHLQAIEAGVRALIAEHSIKGIITHTYEGGHPDHDSVALAVNVVARNSDIAFWEFPLYHAGPSGEMIDGEFIAPSPDDKNFELSAADRELKRQILSHFVTQRDMLERFTLEWERFRPAQSVDFTQPPHPGKLLYERWGFAVDGSVWRAEATKFIAQYCAVK